jgi:hypothetical protein
MSPAVSRYQSKVKNSSVASHYPAAIIAAIIGTHVHMYTEGFRGERSSSSDRFLSKWAIT